MVYNLYNSNTIIQGFCDYLKSSGLTKNSVRFYKSDLKHFSNWLLTKIKSLGASAENLKDALPFLTPDLAGQYQKNLVNNKTPVKSVNRKLSALRKFSEYLFSANLISADFTRSLENIGGNINREQSLIGDFKKHLEDQKASANTIKNYLSDIRRFLNKTPPGQPSLATLKRKQSSLGKFFAWSQKPPFYASFQEKIVAALSAKPRAQKFVHALFYRRPKWYTTYHDISITSYFHLAILIIFSAALGIGAYEQFFRKTSTPLAYPAALTRPNRYLSFQGRLTNNLGTPVTIATNLVFKLYDAETVGNTLWNSGTCSITPDGDGIFSTLLGSACGSEITAAVFSENASVWVGVTVGTDAEATPRVQIATVGYALNAETLQGFSAGTAVSSIPYIDSTGTLVIAAASPKIQSSSGTFAIEGQAMTITTPDTTNGSITVAPDGTGALNLTFEGAAAGGAVNGFVNATNVNITSGALYAGTVASDASGYNFVNFLSGASPTSKFSVSSTGAITSASGLTIGTTSLSETTAANDSGAYLVGAFDEFDNSASANVQAVLNDLDAAIASGGAGSMWTLGSGVIYPTSATNDFAIGGSTLAASIFSIDESAGNFYFGYDNSANPTLLFEATDADAGEFGFNTNDAFFFSNANVGIGSTSPSAKLTINGTTEQLRFSYDASNYQSFTVGSTGDLFIAQDGGAATLALTSGNVGIGTTNPGGKLEVASGNVFFGDTSNANSTQGLTINQGSADDGILALKSSDVAHGMTAIVETDTYGYFSKYSAAAGGLSVLGLVETGVAPGLTLTGYSGLADTAKTTAGLGGAVIGVALVNSTTVQDMSADGNLLAIRNRATTRFIFDAEGTLHSIGASGTDTFGGNGATIMSGNVGIGTTAPSYKLQVSGGAIALDSGQPLYFYDSNAFIRGFSGTSGYIDVAVGGDSRYIKFSTNSNQEKVRIDQSGNVGIGTTAPGAKLEVYGGNIKINGGGLTTTGTAQTALLQNSWTGLGTGNRSLFHIDPNTITGNNSTDLIALHIDLSDSTVTGIDDEYGLKIEDVDDGTGNNYSIYAGAGKVYITGNVGIGTTGPGVKLEVGSSGNTRFAVTTSGASGAFGSIVAASAANTTYLTWKDGGSLLLGHGADIGGSTFTQRVGIDSSGNVSLPTGTLTVSGTGNSSIAGNVGIGTTGPGAKLDVAGTVRSTGKMFINDTANDFMSLGLTINQGAYDDPTITLRSSDVAHGMTSITSTDSYANFQKSQALAGGLTIQGLSDADGNPGDALRLFGIVGEAADTTKSTAAIGVVRVSAQRNNGTGTTTIGADGNLMTIDNGDTTRFIFDAEGTIHSIGTGGTDTFGAGGATIMSGNVGIGTTAPGSKLSVLGGLAVGDATYSDILAPTGGAIIQGNVGIGTTGPGALLEVKYVGSGEGTSVFPTGTWAAKVFMTQDTSTYGGLVVGSRYANNANPIFQVGNLYNSWNPYLTVAGGGGVGIGYVNPGTAALAINGNVGIGTTGPGYNLEIYESASPQLSLNNSERVFILTNNTIDDLLSFFYAGGNRLQFGLTDQWFNSGNVGIGTTSPLGKLHVASYPVYLGDTDDGTVKRAYVIGTQYNHSSEPEGYMTIGGAADSASDNKVFFGGGASGYNAATQLSFYTAANNTTRTGTERVRITSAGNVGIGTTGPGAKLHVVGDIQGTNLYSSIVYSGQYRPSSDISIKFYNWSGNEIVDMGSTGSIGIGGTAAATAPLLYVQSTGNVGIGTTSPSQKLHVVGNCVAGSTLLPIRRRRRRKFNDLESEDDDKDKMARWLDGYMVNNNHSTIQPFNHSDYDYLLCRIDEILPGDEVLSLNEFTGAMKYSRINKLKDMDIREVYELTTKSGRKIRTTAEHPYLTLTTDG